MTHRPEVPMRWTLPVLSASLLVGLAGAVWADDPPNPLIDPPDPFADPLVDPPDPFASPDPLVDPPDPFASPDPLVDPPDPFADPAPVDSATAGASFDLDAVDPLPPAPPLEFHGRANGTLAITRQGESVELLEDNAFELSSVDLYLSYFPTRWIGALGEAELESDLGEGERKLEVEVELLVLELRPLLSDRLRIRFGREPVPFGLERRYYAPPRNELANRPAAFRRVFPGTYSDTGAYVWWTEPVGFLGGEVELELGISKGLTGPDREDRPKQFRKDTNSAPQYSGRLGWTVFDLDPQRKGAGPGEAALPTAIKLSLGGSFLTGEYDRDEKRRVTFWGADAELFVGGLRLRAEAIWSRVEPLASGARMREGIGVYALAAYHWKLERFLLEEVFVAFRYGKADRDERTREVLDVERYHVGVGWIPYPGVLFKAGYEWAHGPGDPGRVIYLELGYSF
ncbi:MAG: hypothetical protein R3F62_19405 [Planctomycetota bacterium]